MIEKSTQPLSIGQQETEKRWPTIDRDLSGHAPRDCTQTFHVKLQVAIMRTTGDNDILGREKLVNSCGIHCRQCIMCDDLYNGCLWSGNPTRPVVDIIRSGVVKELLDSI